MNRDLLAAAATAPLVMLAAVGVYLFSGEGRVDSYAFGVLAVLGAIVGLLRWLPTIERTVPRHLAGVAGVMSLPLLAGWVTGTMLALVHPRYPANEYASRPSYPGLVLGGGARGLTGAVLTYPGLLPAAILVFGLAWVIRRRLTELAAER